MTEGQYHWYQYWFLYKIELSILKFLDLKKITSNLSELKTIFT